MAKEHQLEEIIHGRYQIAQILGKGGVGITYSAIDLETNSTVLKDSALSEGVPQGDTAPHTSSRAHIAIKAVSLAQLNDWKQVELFEREAAVLAKLNHPNIPRYLDYFNIETEKDKVFYIVQQQAPGKSLFQLVESGWRTTEAEVKQIAEQVLSILAYLHSQDPPVIHRDIKPHNLIRDDDGKIFLVDFGAVQNTYYDTLMQGSTVVGTYGYMAPEQFRGKAEPATDLYSLGATILYLLTHRSPAELPQNTLKLDFKSQVNISASFNQWLDKILEPDAEDRFNSAKEALFQLRKKKPVTRNRNTSRILIAFLIFILPAIGIFKLNTYKFDILLKSEYYQKKICHSAKFAKKYINQGRDLNANLSFNKSTKTFLSCMVGKRDLELIELIKTKKDTIDNRKTYQAIMLVHAIYDRDTIAAKELINLSTDINIKFNKNFKYGYRESYFCSESTPLVEAILMKDLDMVKLLIDSGTELNDVLCVAKKTMRQDKVVDPLSMSIFVENFKIIEFLIDNGAKTDYSFIPYTLSKIILFRDIEDYKILKILLENGLDPTEKNPFFRAENLSEMGPKYRGKKGDRLFQYNSLLHFAEARQRAEIVGLFSNYTDRNSQNK